MKTNRELVLRRATNSTYSERLHNANLRLWQSLARERPIATRSAARNLRYDRWVHPMKRLWAPWRMEYICSARKSSGRRSCLFCRLVRSKDDEQNLLLLRSRLGLVLMNRFPYNNGHLMVAPNRHVAELERLTDREAHELFQLLQRSLVVLKRELTPQGFNVGMNLGRVAGAGVAGHLHIHIVPRWNGDTNFMPLVAETKVVSEHLATTYNRLKQRFSSNR